MTDLSRTGTPDGASECGIVDLDLVEAMLPALHDLLARMPPSLGLPADLLARLTTSATLGAALAGLLGVSGEMPALTGLASMDQAARRPAETAAACLLLAGLQTPGPAASFWATLQYGVVADAAAMVLRGQDNGFSAAWSAMERLEPFIPRRAARRDALVLARLRPGEFWPRHRFCRLVQPHRHGLALIGDLLERHPVQVGATASLVAALPAGLEVPPRLTKAFLAACERMPPDPGTGWESLFLAQALERLGRAEAAFALLAECCRPDGERLVRLEMLRVLARLSGRLFGPLAQLRHLVTALRVMPDHVSAPAILEEISTLLTAMPGIRTTEEPALFARGDADLLSLDRQIDLSHALQYWLLLPQHLAESERVPLRALGRLIPDVRRTVVLPRSEVTFRELPDCAAVPMGLDPRKVQGLTTWGTHARRELARIEGDDVYFRTAASVTLAFAANGAPIVDACAGHAGFHARDELMDREVVHLDGAHLSLCVSFGHANYSHFLLDRLPRLALLDGWRGEQSLLVDADSLDWTRDVLEMTGSRARLVPIHLDRTYRIERVTMFGKAQHPLQRGCPEFVHFLRSLVPGRGKPQEPRRLLVHRDRGRRGVENEEEIYAGLIERGFEPVRLELLPVPEQLQLFAEAGIVVGVHGAGLSNIVACRPGTAIVEILPVGYHTPTFSITAQAAGLSYHPYLEVTQHNLALATREQYSDTHVSPALWDPFLDAVLDQMARSSRSP